ncbi:hypothetical protein B0I27_11631 [Arcticibacter pallidicorallinus]|uniref:Endosialidase-like protein n=1 Tax=Arcticibacter pallidicorallinus TaxID=1259464 RepID=A0A2T0TR22_9SPHI|nr:hypothetical protein [Arcticibacter pallidicorallinus]PRY48097.1 hypothetical protein B0I27_11631 [Arcticibacter pallidicorallinus]
MKNLFLISNLFALFFSLGAYCQTNEFYFNGGADVILRHPPRGSGGRALVHDEHNQLSLNYGGDFTGGVRMGDWFWVKNNGALGIGVFEPSEKIEIVNGFLKSGNASFGFNQETNSGPANYMTLGTDNHSSILLGSNLYISSNSHTQLKISKTHSSMSGAGILIPGNSQSYQGSIIFHTAVPASVEAGTVYSNPQVIINNLGNMGLGTMDPQEKLSVNGKIRAKEIKVEMDNWPDYVFSPEYVLPTLTDIKGFIQQNKHLPGIPSADEVADNGIDVGEMNARLLKKIEELTLYLINQNDRLDKQQKEIDLLKKRK